MSTGGPDVGETGAGRRWHVAGVNGTGASDVGTGAGVGDAVGGYWSGRDLSSRARKQRRKSASYRHGDHH